MTCLFLYKNAYSTFGYTIQTTTFENPPNNTMWLRKLPLDLEGIACHLSICQDRLRRGCCLQGESSWRDRKSPGQWKIRSSLDPRLVVKAELDEKSRCSAHINNKATGNKFYHIYRTWPHKILEIQARCVQKWDKQLGKKQGVSNDNERLKEQWCLPQRENLQRIPVITKASLPKLSNYGLNIGVSKLLL